jgi:hypothetical protein
MPHRITDILGELSHDVWEKFRQQSQEEMPQWISKEWWHQKYYLRTSDSDGARPKTDQKGRVEIPYKRKIFHPSSGRFSLPSGPVAYFSESHATNSFESIAQFRDGTLTPADLMPYLQGKIDPDPLLYGYPLNYGITDNALLLDLSDLGSPLLLALEHNWDGSLIDEVILSPRPDAYPLTQEISAAACANGYDGIVYRSVRVPGELQYSGLILPDKNLVMFNKGKVYTPRWQFGEDNGS